MMIRRLENGNDWIEVHDEPVGVSLRYNDNPSWIYNANVKNSDVYVKNVLMIPGWKEVTLSNGGPTSCCTQPEPEKSLYSSHTYCRNCGAKLSDGTAPKPKIFCECGAHATSNPNCHSFWCPEYRGVNR